MNIKTYRQSFQSNCDKHRYEHYHITNYYSTFCFLLVVKLNITVKGEIFELKDQVMRKIAVPIRERYQSAASISGVPDLH